jgi:hypothetical protein
MTKRRPERQELEKLLPWHAARRLSRREADLVERALAADAELARCYDQVRQELADTIHLNETPVPPRHAPWKICSPQSRPRRCVHQAVGRSAERLLGCGPAHSASAFPTCCARRKSPDSAARRLSVIPL